MCIFDIRGRGTTLLSPAADLELIQRYGTRIIHLRGGRSRKIWSARSATARELATNVLVVRRASSNLRDFSGPTCHVGDHGDDLVHFCFFMLLETNLQSLLKGGDPDSAQCVFGAGFDDSETENLLNRVRALP
jgi:hypothetical protein